MSSMIPSKHQQRRILRGLRKRFATFDQRFADTSVSSVQEENRMQSEHEASIQELESTFRTERATEITQCDVEIDRAWTQMEEITFDSLVRQDKRLSELLVSVRQEREKKIKQWNKAKVGLQKEYDAVKPHPGKRFEHKKNELDNFRRTIESEFDRCLQLVASRSLSASVEEPVSQASEGQEYPNLQSIYEALKEHRESIQQSYKRLKQQPAARIVESYRMWVLGVLAGVSAAGIAWMVQPNLIVTIVAGAGVGLLTIVGLILGLRPAMAKAVRTEIPKARAVMMTSERAAIAARKMLEAECQAEQHRLRDEFKAKVATLDADHEREMTELQERLDRETQEIREEERGSRTSAASNQTEQCKDLHRDFKPQYDALLASQVQRKQEKNASHEEMLNATIRSYRDGLAFTRKRVERAVDFSLTLSARLKSTLEERFPAWENKQAWGGKIVRMNPEVVLPIGSMQVELASHIPIEKNPVQPSSFVSEVPLLFRLIEDGALVVEASTPTARANAQVIARNALLRALTSLPAGQFQTTIVDPDGLGKDYSWLMHLADADPRMVNYRVWTQTNHISEQVARLSHHTEDVIQQLLRDRYRDLREYNRDAGSMSEAYRILVWSRFPIGLDESSWKSVCSLLTSGGRCGVAMILLYDPSVAWPVPADPKRLEEAGLYLQADEPSPGAGVQLRLNDVDFRPFPVQVQQPPDERQQEAILEKCVEEALQGNRVEVPFDSILGPDVSLGQGDSSEGLSIPIGQAGIGRALHLRLGVGTAQHVLIAGKTGSGKSSLLHTLISSAALKYAPDQLRLVLLDFKKGVEFQVYAETEVPHADIIGIESQREFGLSTLEYLDRVMQTRGELFRSAGVQDVASWMRSQPNRPMPRILVLVDEFQELFVEDDKLAQQAAMLLDRIVRQGRSFGMHVVLASQTLGGAYSLPRTTLAQMAVRIALQCEGADAMLILSEDNLAAERLRHAGQAVYNDASGRVEGNQPFQVAYISKAKQLEKLGNLPSGKPFVNESNGGLTRCVVFEGHKAANWDADSVQSTLEQMLYRESTAFGSVLGDSVSIEPAVAVQWSRQAGRNLLLVGGEDRNAASCLMALLKSANSSVAQRFPTRLQIHFLDGSRPDDVHTSQIAKVVKGWNPENQVGDVRGLEGIMTSTSSELAKRMENPNVSAPPMFLVVTQLARFRDLRKGEEFSFGEQDSTKLDQQFQKILQDGPAVGIHTLIWADNWNTVSRWIPRQGMHDIELRVLMQMSANDSNHLIDSPAANRLDAHVLLIHDEASGQSRKFRPYQANQLFGQEDK